MRRSTKEKKGIRKSVWWILAAVLVLGPWNARNAQASSIEELQKQIAVHQQEVANANAKADKLKDQQGLIEELIDDLNAEILNTMTCIGLKEDEIAEKQEEIDGKEAEIEATQAHIEQTEQEYYDAKAKEEKQIDDMQIRARRIYETGTSSVLNMILRGSSFGSLLNRMDYAEQVYSYDRNQKEELQATKELVKDLWEKLEVEKANLEMQKTAFEGEKAALELAKQELKNQKDDLDRALAVRRKESADFEAQIKKAQQEASVAKTLIQQEQKALKKLQDEQKKGNTAAANATYAETSYSAIVDNATGSELGKKIAKYALQYVGNPYVLGGTSLTKGTDCSGFTYRIYSDFGYTITRTSTTQRSDGKEVSYANAQPGDIICYSGHVALYIGGGKIVHASNKRDCIKVSNAAYREILTVRRII